MHINFFLRSISKIDDYKMVSLRFSGDVANRVNKALDGCV